MNTLEIKPVPPTELDTVLEVYHDCEDFLALGPDAIASLPMVRKDIAAAEQAGGVYRGIYTEGRLMGVLSYIPRDYQGNSFHAFLILLMIIPSCRERSIGTRIVEMVEQEIRAGGRITVIYTAVQVNNLRALKFWERNGYRVCGARQDQPDGTAVFPMRKDL